MEYGHECIKTISENIGLLNRILVLQNDPFFSFSNDRIYKLFDLNTYNCIRTFYFPDKIPIDLLAMTKFNYLKFLLAHA